MKNNLKLLPELHFKWNCLFFFDYIIFKFSFVRRNISLDFLSESYINETVSEFNVSLCIILFSFQRVFFTSNLHRFFTSNLTLFGSVTLSSIHFYFVEVKMNPIAIFPMIQVVFGLFAISEAFVFSDIVEWNSYKVTITVYETVRI